MREFFTIKLRLLTCGPAAFVLGAMLAMSTTSQALPPAPGNTCGGGGVCDDEADMLAIWEAEVEDLVEVQFAMESGHLDATQEELLEVTLMLWAAMAERDLAQTALEECIHATSCTN